LVLDSITFNFNINTKIFWALHKLQFYF